MCGVFFRLIFEGIRFLKDDKVSQDDAEVTLMSVCDDVWECLVISKSICGLKVTLIDIQEIQWTNY